MFSTDIAAAAFIEELEKIAYAQRRTSGAVNIGHHHPLGSRTTGYDGEPLKVPMSPTGSATDITKQVGVVAPTGRIKTRSGAGALIWGAGDSRRRQKKNSLQESRGRSRYAATLREMGKLTGAT